MLLIHFLAATLTYATAASPQSACLPNSLVLTPEAYAENKSELIPFTARWRYFRKGSLTPETGMQVSAVLAGYENRWVYDLISHFPEDGLGDLHDRTEFIKDSFILKGISTPNMPEEEIVDIRLTVEDGQITGSIIGRDTGSTQPVQGSLDQPVFGAPIWALLAGMSLEPGMQICWPTLDFETLDIKWNNASIGETEVLHYQESPVSTRIVTLDNARFWISPLPPYEIRREFVVNEELAIIWELID